MNPNAKTIALVTVGSLLALYGIRAIVLYVFDRQHFTAREVIGSN